MKTEKWFAEKFEELKDDPEYLKERIDLLRGEVEVLERKLEDTEYELRRAESSGGRDMEIVCPYCGRIAVVGSCGNFWCVHCRTGHWRY